MGFRAYIFVDKIRRGFKKSQYYVDVIYMKVPLDNNTAFFVGGADGDTGNRTSYCDTYFLDLNTKAWTPGPNMIHCRFQHTCNMITNATSGQREIVVVGGFDQQRQHHCKFIQEVEIFNLDTMQWRNGEDDSVMKRYFWNT